MLNGNLWLVISDSLSDKMATTREAQLSLFQRASGRTTHSSADLLQLWLRVSRMVRFFHAFCTARPTHAPRGPRRPRRSINLLGSSRCAKRPATCALTLLHLCGRDGGLDPSQKAFGSRSSFRAP